MDVLLPPVPLRPGVVCAIVRHVPAGAHAAAMHAVVQANRYACLNLVVEGGVEVLGRGRLPAASLAGPFSSPVATQVDGTVASVSIVVEPWLAARALGLDLSTLVDRIADLDPAHAQLARLLRSAARLTRDARNADTFWSALQASLAPCDPVQPPPLAFGTLLRLGVHAAARECGLSERHYRRRFMRDMGLRPGAWVRIRRLERVMQGLAAPHERRAPPALSELALDAGFADQAHMTREVRSLVGHSPSGLHGLLKPGADAPWPLQAARPISSRPRG